MKHSILGLGFASMIAGAAGAADLTITPYNPGEDSLFAVTSTLIAGPTEAVLVDAQFQRDDAQELVQMIQDSGKTLTTVLVSHGDPDFYFGLDVIRAAFPEVQIVATPKTVEKITASIEGKFAYWGPILGENAPQELIIPDVLKGSSLSVDGETIDVIGLNGHDPAHTFAWVPSERTVLGGVVVYDNLHVWIADNQTPESRESWNLTLDQLEALEPVRIIPGHYLGDAKFDQSAVDFTRQYVARFEGAAAASATSEELIGAVMKLYPDFPNTADLGLSAKVIMGEVSWP